MEYEIKDEPQGLPDKPDGVRDGGLAEYRFLFRAPPKPGERRPASPSAPGQFEPY